MANRHLGTYSKCSYPWHHEDLLVIISFEAGFRLKRCWLPAADCSKLATTQDLPFCAMQRLQQENQVGILNLLAWSDQTQMFRTSKEWKIALLRWGSAPHEPRAIPYTGRLKRFSCQVSCQRCKPQALTLAQ